MTVITNDKHTKEVIYEFLRIIISAEKISISDLSNLNKLLNNKPIKGLSDAVSNKVNAKVLDSMLDDMTNDIFNSFKHKLSKYSGKFK